MGKKKLLEKARNNPVGLNLKEFEMFLHRCGWNKMGQEVSHRLWCSPQGFRLPVQPRKDGKAKGYQVRQFFKQYDRENSNG